MDIRQVLTTVNQMEAEGVIDRYGIGGAVGATFYLEPAATLDVDVFVVLHAVPGSCIVSPKPIFDWLTVHGYKMEGEHMVIGGWPVQFLPPTGPLIEEAMAEAVSKDVEGTPARVFTAEHLCAISLQTGRAKDKARVLQFVESGVMNARAFQTILTRHGLVERWRQFEKQFLGDKS